MGKPSGRKGSLLQSLRDRHVRITSQRKALIETIEEADGHLDAYTLLERARRRSPDVDLATVYRTLELLKKQGLIDELDLMHLHGEKHYYEARATRSHIHLACFRCGLIEEFVSPLYEKLTTEVATSRGFQVEVSRFEVGGICRRCSSSEGNEKSKGIHSV